MSAAYVLCLEQMVRRDAPLYAQDSIESPWHVDYFLSLWEDLEEIEEVEDENIADVVDMAAFIAQANAALGGGNG